ncbi:MAG: LysR family transcriptional regulator [Labilithrix sp.]|nr:LysR family transcriptional regulator [Labilithrix sp.]MBX3221320.1 LysR family transcriptional regulator [Labilithrix sp.]
MNATQEIAPDLAVTFVAVAEALSFSKAALRLGITKGTVSRRIARLEEIAGVELVRRSTHHVALSATGRELYARASGPVQALRTLVTELPDRESALTGVIRLTAPAALGVSVLAGVIEQFCRRHPDVSFDLRLSNERLDLLAHDIDIALRVAGGPLQDSRMVARRIGAVRVGYYASPEYLGRKGEPEAVGADGHDWLSFAPRDAHERRRSRPHRRVVVDDYLVLRELIRRGVGIGPLGNIFAEPLLREGVLVRVLRNEAPPSGAYVYLVVPSHRTTPRRVSAFRAHLVKSFEAAIAK